MWPDRVSNPGPPTYESGALPIALRGPAWEELNSQLSTECKIGILKNFSNSRKQIEKKEHEPYFIVLALQAS